MFYVYSHICPNNKVYIGITCQKPQCRWKRGKGYKNNKYFYRAINKYKWENIKHQILYENLTKEEAEQKEIELIKQYKSNNQRYGYNIEYGGCHNGKTAYNKGIKKTKEEKYKDMLRQKTRKRIICLETQIIYESIGQASRELNISTSSLNDVLKKKNKTTHGMKFEYVKEE